MKRIAPTSPSPLHHPSFYPVTFVYSGLIVVATVGQLFSFEKMVQTAITGPVFYGRVGLIIVTAMVVMGVFSLPYLLRLKMSRLMRSVSMICAILLPMIWMAYAWRVKISGTHEVGLFGAEVSRLNGGEVAVVVSYLTLVIMIFAVDAIGVPLVKRLRKHK